MRINIFGASGLLGTHLVPLLESGNDIFAPSHSECDITKEVIKKDCDICLHLAAYTKVEQAEVDRMECFDVNVRGTLNLLNAYPNTPFVYISSEYAGKPVNFYSLTKWLAEQLVMTHENYLIIRTLFKPRPWKYPKAFVDQFTMGDYVDVIAPLIDEAVVSWKQDGGNFVYIGTGRKSIYDLARQTREVEPMSIKDIETVRLPADYC